MLDIDIIQKVLSYKRRQIIKPEEWKKAIDAWMNEKRTFVIGSYSATDKHKKEKLIREDALIEVNGNLLTFSEVGKAILETTSTRKKRKFPFKKEDFEAMLKNCQGLYAAPGVYEGHYIYLDIKSFYFTVYSNLLGIEYRRGKYVLLRKDIKLTEEQKGFLRGNKRLRNTLFGIMRTTQKTCVIEGKKYITQAHNKYLHPQLANYIYDLQKAIAYKLITEFGAVYYNTDGAIIPIRELEAAKNFLLELGFKTAIKAEWHDSVTIKAVGVYGSENPLEYKTKHFERVNIGKNPFMNIDLDDDEVNFILIKHRKLIEKI